MNCKKMNEKPIEYKGHELFFYESAYMMDGTKAIFCETENGEPFAVVSINLGDYGIAIRDDEIALNHDLSGDFKAMFIEHFCTGETRPVAYGFAVSEIIVLKDRL